MDKLIASFQESVKSDRMINDLASFFTEVLHNMADRVGAKCPLCRDVMKQDEVMKIQLDGEEDTYICDNCYLNTLC